MAGYLRPARPASAGLCQSQCCPECGVQATASKQPQSMTSTNTPYQHDQYQHVWEDGPAHHHSVLRVCQERHQHWNDSTVHHHLHKEGKAIWYHSAIEGVWLGLHLNLLLLSICEEGEGPAGVHLHCQVIILYQVDQGRQGLEGDQMS